MATPQKKLSKKELDTICRNHLEWLASAGGKKGRRADFQNSNLLQADFSNRNLKGANFGAALLIKAKFLNTDLRGANFSGANLIEANFHNANLRDANLKDASLCEANFTDAQLSHADLTDADLSLCNFAAARGLVGKQFAGTDLHGASLPSSTNFDIPMTEVGELAKSAKIVFLAVILSCFYAWINIGTITDAQLFTGSIPSKIPLLGVETNLIIFYYLGPLILFCVFLYLHLYLQRLWERLAGLPAVFPDGRGLDEKVYPWIFVGFAGWHLKRLKSRRPSFSRAQFWLCLALAYWLIPLTIHIFWGGYITKKERWISLYHTVLFAICCSFSITFYLAGRETLRKYRSKWNRWGLILALFFLVAVVYDFLAIASIKGYRHDNLPSSARNLNLAKDKEQSISRYEARYWVPDMLQWFLIASYADFQEQDISKKPDNWMDDSSQLPLVKGAALRGAHLQYCNGYRTFMVNADLRFALLEGACFQQADLRSANLLYANCHFVDLANSKLQNSILAHANLERSILSAANLENANCKGAKFRAAVFQDANLKEAKLDEAIFDYCSLFFSNLSKTSCKSATFVSANLSAAVMRFSDCSEATFQNSDWALVDFTGANLQKADLSEIKNWTRAYSLNSANLFGVTNAPEGFLEWATNKMGAVMIESEKDWLAFRNSVFTNTSIIPPLSKPSLFPDADEYIGPVVFPTSSMAP